MGFFKREKKVIREIRDAAWGHLVSVHHVDVDTLTKEMRCVERKEVADGGAVTYLRIFKPAEAEQKGVVVTGWETFDEHPDLIRFEGYLTSDNVAHLERRK